MTPSSTPAIASHSCSQRLLHFNHELRRHLTYARQSTVLHAGYVLLTALLVAQGLVFSRIGLLACNQ